MLEIDKKGTTPACHLGLVISRYNGSITRVMHESATTRLRELDLSDQVTTVWVPGAIEIPITVQALLNRDIYDAIVCLGAVIRGETDHYNYVCDRVNFGCHQISLDYEIPVIFGVLTTENETQANDRLGGKHGNKAREAIDTALEMVAVLREINDDDDF